jgi:hypothetical protein
VHSSVDSLFPLALGIIFLLLIAGAILTAAISVVVLLTGVLYFAGGLFFGRAQAHSPWGTGISLLAPFLLMSVFLVVTFGFPFVLLPALAAGGVTAGVAARKRCPGSAGPFILGALWIGILLLVAFLVVPGLFDHLKITGMPQG